MTQEKHMTLSLDNFPDFLAAKQKRRQLRDKAKLLDERARELKKQLYEASEAAADDLVTAEAKRLLNGGGGEPAENIAGVDVLAELRTVERRRAVVQQALVLHQESYDEVLNRRSAEIAETFVARHEQAIRRIDQAVLELAKANQEEAQVHRDLAAACVASSHRVEWLGFPNVGSPNDMNSPAFRWRSFVKARGFDLGDEE
jgi:hypothetical protein